MKLQHMLLICLFLMLGKMESFGQQLNPIADNLLWEVTQLTDTASNVTTAYTCVFESDPESKIIWTQSRLLSELAITGRSGTWTNVADEGEVLFQALFNEKPCTVRFSRKNGAPEVRLNLIEDGKPSFPIIFHVNSISVKP